jgi:hypothetical protein
MRGLNEIASVKGYPSNHPAHEQFMVHLRKLAIQQRKMQIALGRRNLESLNKASTKILRGIKDDIFTRFICFVYDGRCCIEGCTVVFSENCMPQMDHTAELRREALAQLDEKLREDLMAWEGANGAAPECNYVSRLRNNSCTSERLVFALNQTRPICEDHHKQRTSKQARLRAGLRAQRVENASSDRAIQLSGSATAGISLTTNRSEPSKEAAGANNGSPSASRPSTSKPVGSLIHDSIPISPRRRFLVSATALAQSRLRPSRIPQALSFSNTSVLPHAQLVMNSNSAALPSRSEAQCASTGSSLTSQPRLGVEGSAAGSNIAVPAVLPPASAASLGHAAAAAAAAASSAAPPTRLKSASSKRGNAVLVVEGIPPVLPASLPTLATSVGKGKRRKHIVAESNSN